MSAEIAARLRPYEAELLRLETIPGVGRHIAEILAAEMGLNMEQFPSAGHLASWAGMCLGNHESAGKRKKGPVRKGNIAHETGRHTRGARIKPVAPGRRPVDQARARGVSAAVEVALGRF